MTRLPGVEKLFEGRHFEREIIVLCVRWALRFKLRFPISGGMMAERGLSMATPPSCVGCIIVFLNSSVAGASSRCL